MLRRASILALGLLAPLTMTPAASTRAGWEAKDIRVVETVPGQKGSAETRLELASNGDARVTVDLSDTDSRTKGTILLIAGRWMLTRGFTPKPGEEIDVLDTAALNSQLVMALLNAAAPKGPPAPGPPQRVLFSEKSKPIRVSTQSASGEYNPPWKLEGTVTVAAAAAPATYHLSFTFSAEGKPVTLDLAGSIGTPSPPVFFPDSMTLVGWAIHKIGPYQEQLPDGTKFDYGARAQSPKATTVGELRKLQ
jgi:hypothetical protein